MKRTVMLFWILSWTIVLFSSIACAENTLIIFLDEYPEPTLITEVFVLEQNEFGDSRFFHDQVSEETSAEIELFDDSGSIILKNPVEGYSSHMTFDDRISKIRLISDETVIDELDITFCDGDGVCEPCDEIACETSENVLTCTDCQSGQEDLFCDVVEDGICDPDCDSNIADPDCRSEYLQNEGLGEYVASMALMHNQPALTILDNGDNAAVAQAEEYHGQYCTETAGGKICAIEERCSGRFLEYIQGMRCCIGTCMAEEEVDIAETFPEEPVGIPAIENIPSDYDEGLENIPDGEFPYETILELGERQTAVQKVEQLGRFVETAFSKIDMFHVAAVLFAVLLILSISLFFFRRSAASQVGATGPSLLQKAPPTIQTRIDALGSAGHNYQEIEKMLMQKGFDKPFVDSQINIHYRKRMESQKSQVKK